MGRLAYPDWEVCILFAMVSAVSLPRRRTRGTGRLVQGVLCVGDRGGRGCPMSRRANRRVGSPEFRIRRQGFVFSEHEPVTDVLIWLSMPVFLALSTRTRPRRLITSHP
jgi:hypothetical protein